MCWESKYQEAFEAIKEELTKTLVRVYVDWKADNIILVDRFINGLATVLLQKGRPVIYVSRTLTVAETGYLNIEKEVWIGEATSLHVWKQS